MRREENVCHSFDAKTLPSSSQCHATNIITDISFHFLSIITIEIFPNVQHITLKFVKLDIISILYKLFFYHSNNYLKNFTLCTSQHIRLNSIQLCVFLRVPPSFVLIARRSLGVLCVCMCARASICSTQGASAT